MAFLRGEYEVSNIFFTYKKALVQSFWARLGKNCRTDKLPQYLMKCVNNSTIEMLPFTLVEDK